MHLVGAFGVKLTETVAYGLDLFVFVFGPAPLVLILVISIPPDCPATDTISLEYLYL